MTAALTAYLERLAHPARKAYATAYAEHLVTGSAKPSAPKGVDAETASKIACKVERYAKDTTVTPEPLDGLTHLPDAVRAYAAEHGDAELLDLIEAFVPSAETMAEEHLGDYYNPETTPAFVETVDVDVLDLTGLEPGLARELALKLARWNGGGRVYSRRAGRRYLNRTVRRIDLNDPTVRALPNYDDLLAVISERGIVRA